MKWLQAKVAEFCRTGSGGTPARAMDSRYYRGTIPWVKSGELEEAIITTTGESITEEAISESSAKLIEPGAILVAMYGATVGRSAILGVTAATNQAICHVIPDGRIADNLYVWFALRHKVPSFLANRLGGAQPNISQQIIRETTIPIPPLSEQRRIAELLQMTDALRSKRATADKQADRVLPRLFNSMFGDPLVNPKKWSEVPVSHFVESLQGGKNIAADSGEANSSRVKVLKVSAVTSMEYDPEESKPLPPEFEPPSHYFVREGDLLFSRANTTELVGACAYVFETPPDRVLPDKIWRFVWKLPIQVDPLFVWYLFRHPSVRLQLGRIATGTSGSMKNISMEKLLALRVPLPPLNLQQDFAVAVRRMRHVDESRAKSRDNLHSLWTAVMRNAFSGELTREWRAAHEEKLLAEIEKQAKLLGRTVEHTASV